MRRTYTMLLVQLGLSVFCFCNGTLAAGLPLEQEVQAGRGFVSAFTEQYGASDNRQYQETAEGVLTRLVKASGERPELEWHVAVLKYHPNNPVAKNASAWPGGYIVTDEEFFRILKQGAGDDAARMQELMAGVLAHEMAHVIRHDTDALVPLYFKEPGAAPQQLLFTLKSTGDAPRVNAAEQRQKENECDRHGAFYLLHAGYRIDDMIGVFRQLANEEVDEVLFNSDLSHSRANERVGNLLAVQDQVVEDERLYDEAVTILRLGLGEEMLQVAAQNLNAVAERFPRVLPVRHARAVLYHRRYLARVSPAKLGCKPSFSFYRFRATRSLADDSLQLALREYEAILKDYEAEGYKGLGPTAAAYALALTNAGRMEQALEWAQRAVSLVPKDWNGYNILGIVLQKMNRPAEAAQQLRRAVALASPAPPRALVETPAMTPTLEERAAWRYLEALAPLEHGPALFNLGVALKALGDKAAAQHFLAYLATDSQSDWAQLAREHLSQLKVPAGAIEAGAPPAAGIVIGMSDIELRKKWGNPGAIGFPRPGVQAWRYKPRGLSIFLDESSRVRAAMMSSGYTGKLGVGVKIGVPASSIEKTWGKAAAVAQSGTRAAWAYPAQGVTFLITKGKLAKALWSPAPPPGGAVVQASLALRPGESAEQVEKGLGAPDTGKGTETDGGVWTYDRLGLRVRFDKQGSVALVTITRPSTANIAGVRVGDTAARLRQLVGSAFVTPDVDNSETYNYPDKGVAFVVRNAEVAVITLFERQK